MNLLLWLYIYKLTAKTLSFLIFSEEKGKNGENIWSPFEYVRSKKVIKKVWNPKFIW